MNLVLLVRMVYGIDRLVFPCEELTKLKPEDVADGFDLLAEKSDNVSASLPYGRVDSVSALLKDLIKAK